MLYQGMDVKMMDSVVCTMFGAKIIKGFFLQVGNYNQVLLQCNI